MTRCLSFTVCADPRPRVSTRQLQVCMPPWILFPRCEGRIPTLQRHSAGGGVRKTDDGKIYFYSRQVGLLHDARKVADIHLIR